MTPEEIQRLIDQETEAVNNLNKKYQGVRPSWVSCELALMSAEIERLKKQLGE